MNYDLQTNTRQKNKHSYSAYNLIKQKQYNSSGYFKLIDVKEQSLTDEKQNQNEFQNYKTMVKQRHLNPAKLKIQKNRLKTLNKTYQGSLPKNRSEISMLSLRQNLHYVCQKCKKKQIFPHHSNKTLIISEIPNKYSYQKIQNNLKQVIINFKTQFTKLTQLLIQKLHDYKEQFNKACHLIVSQCRQAIIERQQKIYWLEIKQINNQEQISCLKKQISQISLKLANCENQLNFKCNRKYKANKGKQEKQKDKILGTITEEEIECIQ